LWLNGRARRRRERIRLVGLGSSAAGTKAGRRVDWLTAK